MRKLAILGAVLAFLAVSAVLARWLSAEGVERGAVQDLLAAQARGDAPAMLRTLDGCAPRPRCRATVGRLARTLRTPGRPEIVAYDSATSHALTPRTGPTRVVWTADRRLPTVQCVTVARKRSILTGPVVTLTAVSAPIPRTGPCPGA